MKRAMWLALCAASMTSPANAGELQAERDNLLYALTPDSVAQRRSACAMGQIPAKQARLKKVGLQALSAGAYCVTVLTRAGRDGALAYARDPRAQRVTSAIAFDMGFVSAYLRHEALPADLPAMEALLPVADRCLEQKEPNQRLCGLAGQVLGARAATGELVPT